MLWKRKERGAARVVRRQTRCSWSTVSLGGHNSPSSSHSCRHLSVMPVPCCRHSDRRGSAMNCSVMRVSIRAPFESRIRNISRTCKQPETGQELGYTSHTTVTQSQSLEVSLKLYKHRNPRHIKCLSMTGTIKNTVWNQSDCSIFSMLISSAIMCLNSAVKQ